MGKREPVYARLKELGIAYEVMEHPAVFTIDEIEQLGLDPNGEICKNLFLRDDKGRRHFLVTLCGSKQVNLKALGAKLGASRLGFASAERLEKYLNLKKGEVTPLGIINDADHAVEVILDRDLADFARIGVHPNDNTATVWLNYDDLRAFILQSGNPLQEIQI